MSSKATVLEMRNSDAMNTMTSHTSQDKAKRKQEEHITDNVIEEDWEDFDDQLVFPKIAAPLLFSKREVTFAFSFF